MKSKKEKKHKDGLDSLPWLSQETKNSIVAVVMFLFGALSALSLLEGAGIAGQWIAQGLTYLFGNTAFLIPLAFLLGGVSLLTRLHKPHSVPVAIGSALFLISIIGLAELLGQSGSAGAIGLGLAYPVRAFLSPVAGIVLFSGLLVVGLLVLFDVSFASIVSVFSPRQELPEEQNESLDEQSEWASTPLETLGRQGRSNLGFIAGESKKEPEEKEEGTASSDSAYEPPPLTLLDPDGAGPSSGDIQANKNIIQRTLEEFGIEVEMGEVSVGPTVTQYTLKPAQGVNLTRITALSKNLSLALAAHPIRIEAPIPGKALVGMEIPNKQAAMVRLRSLIESNVGKKLPSSLVLGLGRDVSGQAVLAYLDKMPHLLISGSTGSGKSICLNAILINLLYFNSPRNLRFLLIDPKRVEFASYEGIPHLIAPVIVDTKKAISALKWAIAEMERRYELLEGASVRDIKSYNDAAKKKADVKPLPYLVIIIDEMADLMMKYKREVEASIVRIAQMARAVGIHLITATQRPSTDVVTGLIKANIIARVAFKMPTQIDSRTILDQAGAEKLLGYGDMLFMSGEAHGLKRIQGTYVSDKEVKKVAEYLRRLPWEDEYAAQFDAGKEKGTLLNTAFDSDDELYEDAKIIAREAGRISASLLQRKLQVGYARAARLLDTMEEEGIIGPAQGAKPREVIKE